jgi:hypothetical protein
MVRPEAWILGLQFHKDSFAPVFGEGARTEGENRRGQNEVGAGSTRVEDIG